METNLTKKFHWLLGRWRTVNNQWIFEEWWQKDEHSLQGLRYHFRRGKKRSEQRFYLEERGNDIYYIVRVPDSVERVELKMNFSDGCMAIFENLTGTLPKFVRYELDSRKHLHALSEGMQADGTDQRVKYTFWRYGSISERK